MALDVANRPAHCVLWDAEGQEWLCNCGASYGGDDSAAFGHYFSIDRFAMARGRRD